MIQNLAWMQHAACTGMDPRVFYSEGRHAREQVHTARQICMDCPVRTLCAEWAISTGERWGVWGGMSQQELRQRRNRFADRWKSTDALTKPPAKKREPAKCGTNSGYQKHIRKKTEICGPCKRAHADADNRLRRTGTTKAAA